MRNKRKLALNTYEEINLADGTLSIWFWQTEICRFDPGRKTVVLRTDGHRTFTTKDRFNLILRAYGISVYQEKGDWWIRDIVDGGCWPFIEEMVLQLRREVTPFVGGKGAYELFHERQAWTALGRLWQLRKDAGPAISLEAQDYACQFLREHGTRAARRYLKANVRKDLFR